MGKSQKSRTQGTSSTALAAKKPSHVAGIARYFLPGKQGPTAPEGSNPSPTLSVLNQSYSQPPGTKATRQHKNSNVGEAPNEHLRTRPIVVPEQKGVTDQQKSRSPELPVAPQHEMGRRQRSPSPVAEVATEGMAVERTTLGTAAVGDGIPTFRNRRLATSTDTHNVGTLPRTAAANTMTREDRQVMLEQEPLARVSNAGLTNEIPISFGKPALFLPPPFLPFSGAPSISGFPDISSLRGSNSRGSWLYGRPQVGSSFGGGNEIHPWLDGRRATRSAAAALKAGGGGGGPPQGFSSHRSFNSRDTAAAAALPFSFFLDSMSQPSQGEEEEARSIQVVWTNSPNYKRRHVPSPLRHASASLSLSEWESPTNNGPSRARAAYNNREDSMAADDARAAAVAATVRVDRAPSSPTACGMGGGADGDVNKRRDVAAGLRSSGADIAPIGRASRLNIRRGLDFEALAEGKAPQPAAATAAAAGPGVSIMAAGCDPEMMALTERRRADSRLTNSSGMGASEDVTASPKSSAKEERENRKAIRGGRRDTAETAALHPGDAAPPAGTPACPAVENKTTTCQRGEHARRIAARRLATKSKGSPRQAYGEEPPRMKQVATNAVPIHDEGIAAVATPVPGDGKLQVGAINETDHHAVIHINSSATRSNSESPDSNPKEDVSDSRTNRRTPAAAAAAFSSPPSSPHAYFTRSAKKRRLEGETPKASEGPGGHDTPKELVAAAAVAAAAGALGSSFNLKLFSEVCAAANSADSKGVLLTRSGSLGETSPETTATWQQRISKRGVEAETQAVAVKLAGAVLEARDVPPPPKVAPLTRLASGCTRRETRMNKVKPRVSDSVDLVDDGEEDNSEIPSLIEGGGGASLRRCGSAGGSEAPAHSGEGRSAGGRPPSNASGIAASYHPFFTKFSRYSTPSQSSSQAPAGGAANRSQQSTAANSEASDTRVLAATPAAAGFATGCSAVKSSHDAPSVPPADPILFPKASSSPTRSRSGVVGSGSISGPARRLSPASRPLTPSSSQKARGGSRSTATVKTAKESPRDGPAAATPAAPKPPLNSAASEYSGISTRTRSSSSSSTAAALLSAVVACSPGRKKRELGTATPANSKPHRETNTNDGDLKREAADLSYPSARRGSVKPSVSPLNSTGIEPGDPNRRPEFSVGLPIRPGPSYEEQRGPPVDSLKQSRSLGGGTVGAFRVLRNNNGSATDTGAGIGPGTGENCLTGDHLSLRSLPVRDWTPVPVSHAGNSSCGSDLVAGTNLYVTSVPLPDMSRSLGAAELHALRSRDAGSDSGSAFGGNRKRVGESLPTIALFAGRDEGTRSEPGVERGKKNGATAKQEGGAHAAAGGAEDSPAPPLLAVTSCPSTFDPQSSSHLYGSEPGPPPQVPALSSHGGSELSSFVASSRFAAASPFSCSPAAALATAAGHATDARPSAASSTGKKEVGAQPRSSRIELLHPVIPSPPSRADLLAVSCRPQQEQANPGEPCSSSGSRAMANTTSDSSLFDNSRLTREPGAKLGATAVAETAGERATDQRGSESGAGPPDSTTRGEKAKLISPDTSLPELDLDPGFEGVHLSPDGTEDEEGGSLQGLGSMEMQPPDSLLRAGTATLYGTGPGDRPGRGAVLRKKDLSCLLDFLHEQVQRVGDDASASESQSDAERSQPPGGSAPPCPGAGPGSGSGVPAMLTIPPPANPETARAAGSNDVNGPPLA